MLVLDRHSQFFRTLVRVGGAWYAICSPLRQVLFKSRNNCPTFNTFTRLFWVNSDEHGFYGNCLVQMVVVCLHRASFLPQRCGRNITHCSRSLWWSPVDIPINASPICVRRFMTEELGSRFTFTMLPGTDRTTFLPRHYRSSLSQRFLSLPLPFSSWEIQYSMISHVLRELRGHGWPNSDTTTKKLKL